MRILHILEDYSYQNGGVKTFVTQLHQFINNNTEHESYVYAPNCEEDRNTFPQKSLRFWRFIPGNTAKLRTIARESKIDLIHIHGIWMHPQYAAAKFANKNNIPVILSLHGMLRPDIHKKSTFKKDLYLRLLLKPIFRGITAIHTITTQEQEEFLSIYPDHASKTFCINNYIQMDERLAQNSTQSSEKYLLYLGRLTQIKRIDVLLKAIANLPKSYPKLFIAGEKNAYYKELNELVKKLGIEDRVTFLGHISGKEKEELYRNSLVFISPSKSEVVGMVNLEAVKEGTLIIASNNAGLDEGWVKSGAILIDPEVDEITQAIRELVLLSKEERESRINTLRNFVYKNYSWEKKGGEWITAYKKIKKER